MNITASDNHPFQIQDYERVAKAIRFLQDHQTELPSLPEVANHIGLSPYHFQRLFLRWAGLSPKQFLSSLALQNAKALLRQGEPVLETALAVGMSGPSRLHDLFLHVEGMTPGEYKSSGQGLQIGYGFHATPFGQALVLTTPRGLCGLHFLERGEEDTALLAAKKEWPLSQFMEESKYSAGILAAALAPVRNSPLTLHLKGTRFQIKVWQALLSIPEGHWVSYQHLAERMEIPNGARAVGQAVGQNPVAWLIPCHRVLRKSGALGGYRWGEARKRTMLAWEAAHMQGG